MYAWKRLSDGVICQTATADTAEKLFERAGFGAVGADKPIKGMLAVKVARGQAGEWIEVTCNSAARGRL